MQRVVELLGDLEERGAALDDVPPGIHAQLLEDGHHAVEDLGHAASGKGGVDVLHLSAGQPGGQQPQLLDGAPAHYGLIVE